MLMKLLYYYFATPEKYARLIGVTVGKNCFIDTKNFSSEPYLISIGNNCQITSNVFFHTHGGAQVLRNKYPDFDFFGKIVIKDFVYIGAGTHIMPGVTIGEGVLVGGGSVVTKSIPPNTVVGGNPARIIGTIFDFEKKMIPFNLNTKYMDKKNKRKYLQSLSDCSFLHKDFIK